jgi:hypothetical protein
MKTFFNSGVDADTVDTYHASQTPTADTIPVADSTGKIDSGWLPSTLDADTVDTYHASQTPAPNTIPVANATGKISPEWIGVIDADKVDGFHASITPAPNTIPVADANGKIDSGWITSSGATATVVHVPNGSFEFDTDNNGIPDNWEITLYQNGSGGFYTTAPAHGAKAYYFTRSSGTGNGGGELVSDFIPVDERLTYKLQLFLWSTAAGIKNLVDVLQYNKDKSLISIRNLYTSTSNPTSPTLFEFVFTPETSTRFIKIRLIGGATDTDVAATTFFDGVELTATSQMVFVASPAPIAEISVPPSSWHDWTDAGSVTVNLPYSLNNKTIKLYGFWAELHSTTTYPAYMRFRVGSVYSNEAAVSSNYFQTYWFGIQNFSVNGSSFTLTMELIGPSGSAGRKSGNGLDLFVL